ncbi:hypothetical protein BDQ17DRAFT_370850 [Cyathus striatus]|nr:hypothetical protein BDQ17DRAFT_370850 [Cyathus striatus]
MVIYCSFTVGVIIVNMYTCAECFSFDLVPVPLSTVCAPPSTTAAPLPTIPSPTSNSPTTPKLKSPAHSNILRH